MKSKKENLKRKRTETEIKTKETSTRNMIFDYICNIIGIIALSIFALGFLCELLRFLWVNIKTIASLCIFDYILWPCLCYILSINTEGLLFVPSQTSINAYCTTVCESKSFTDWLFGMNVFDLHRCNECKIAFVNMDAIFKIAFVNIIICLVFYFIVSKPLHSPPWSLLLDLICFVCIMNYSTFSFSDADPKILVAIILFMYARIIYIIDASVAQIHVWRSIFALEGSGEELKNGENVCRYEIDDMCEETFSNLLDIRLRALNPK
jgi:hypothetical protein